MIKTLKKVLLSSLSILSIGFLFWVLLLLNPSMSYANKTQFDHVTVYHNQSLEEETELIIKQAISIVRKSELWNDETSIALCMNDDPIYPKLNPLVGQSTAYALLNKTIIRNCTPKFNKNIAETQWAINNNELRKFNLTWLLAHEFTHNLQYQTDMNYVIGSTLGNINWKLEGHAEYAARLFKNDGALKAKIEQYLIEASKDQNGLPVFELEDGTKQILSYFKYALIVQYLLEEKNMNYQQLCELDIDLENAYNEMIEWHKN